MYVAIYRPFSSFMVTMVNIISTILVGKTVLIIMALEGGLKSCLLRGRELSQDEVSVLTDHLCSKTLQDLCL